MIGIVDYGAGNTRSVMNALDRLNLKYELSEYPETLANCSHLILPGVGHAGSAMRRLEVRDWKGFIQEWTKPFLGICLGMQLMCRRSEEGNTACLDLLSHDIIKFDRSCVRVPAMGWNQLSKLRSPLMQGIETGDRVYFVHGFFLPVIKNTIAVSEYENPYSAAIQKDNYFGVQFHPEKSGKIGLKMLKNFSEL